MTRRGKSPARRRDQVGNGGGEEDNIVHNGIANKDQPATNAAVGAFPPRQSMSKTGSSTGFVERIVDLNLISFEGYYYTLAVGVVSIAFLLYVFVGEHIDALNKRFQGYLPNWADWAWNMIPHLWILAYTFVIAEYNHKKRNYEDSVIVSWNCFKHLPGGKVQLMMPTEETFSLTKMLSDDKKLLRKVEAARKVATPDYPEFFLILKDNNDNQEFLRKLVNYVSSSIRSSAWPKYAASLLPPRKSPSDKKPTALLLPVFEKDKGLKAYHTRAWLIFSTELEWLKDFTNEQIDDPHGTFQVTEEHHRIRIKALRDWAAEYEFNPERIKPTGEDKSKILFLPFEL